VSDWRRYAIHEACGHRAALRRRAACRFANQAYHPKATASSRWPPLGETLLSELYPSAVETCTKPEPHAWTGDSWARCGDEGQQTLRRRGRNAIVELRGISGRPSTAPPSILDSCGNLKTTHRACRPCGEFGTPPACLGNGHRMRPLCNCPPAWGPRELTPAPPGGAPPYQVGATAERRREPLLDRTASPYTTRRTVRLPPGG
jgi:hypothetical protein